MWFGIFHPIDSKTNTCCPGNVLLSGLVTVPCTFVLLRPGLSGWGLSVSPWASEPVLPHAEMGPSQLWLWLKRLMIFLQVAMEVAVGKLLMTLFPERVKQNILAMGQKTGMARNPRFTPENWVPTFFSIPYFWFILKVRWQRLEDRAEYGRLAPNCTVVRLSGQKCNIWDFIQGQLRGLEQWGRVERMGRGEAPNFVALLQMLPRGFLSCSSVELTQVFPRLTFLHAN